MWFLWFPVFFGGGEEDGGCSTEPWLRRTVGRQPAPGGLALPLPGQQPPSQGGQTPMCAGAARSPSARSGMPLGGCFSALPVSPRWLYGLPAPLAGQGVRPGAGVAQDTGVWLQPEV